MQPDLRKKQLLEDLPQPVKFFLLLLVAGLCVFMYENWDDFVKKNPDGDYELKQERKDKLNDKVRRMREECEVYSLRAKTSGVYQCLHCSQGVFYLNKGEVWKYGMTIQGQKRYKTSKLRRLNFYYQQEYIGNCQTALEMELTLIGKYPLIPENMARPIKAIPEMPYRYRLARPAGNLTDE